MPTALERLHFAAEIGVPWLLIRALNDGADVNGLLLGRFGWCTALHWACRGGHPACAKLLLAAGADHSMRSFGATPLCLAAELRRSEGHVKCVAALLSAGADPLTAYEREWFSLGSPVASGNLFAVHLIAEVALSALADLSSKLLRRAVLGASWAYKHGDRETLRSSLATACYLLGAAPLHPQDANLILELLAEGDDWLQLLVPATVAQAALSNHQWALLAAVPSPCPRLGAALPAVLRRSAGEAAQLVRHLPAADQQRLRTLAMCLGAAAQRGLLPPLPSPIMQHILVECIARPGQQELQRKQQQIIQRVCQRRHRAWMLQRLRPTKAKAICVSLAVGASVAVVPCFVYRLVRGSIRFVRSTWWRHMH